ncbi:Protein argonaute [Exophiala xenobiotica]|uniref:Protein argonaute n=1 Tax=Lithohypha guttulata TaxID=1690604 RepID=A0ABR0K8R2_9EURO|nr:Protein argonaute [Lithohypha guttulata]KAK5317298.1 Protein argonaute [Exophiala xenobiotica]
MSSAKRRGQARGQDPEVGGSAARRGPNPARGRVAPFDGPASRGSGSAAGTQSQVAGSATGSRRGSNAGTQAPSQPDSAAGSQSQSAAQVASIARDPAREGPAARATDSARNVDLPASFYNIDNLYALPTEFTKRPGFNQTGKAIQLPVNSYEVVKLPQITIYQYDVIIGNGAEKRIVQQKAWQSKTRKSKVGPDCIYDGNKLAWSMNPYGQIKFMVDLDEEAGKGPSKEGRNAFRVHITPTKKMDLSVIMQYLQGRMQQNAAVLEAITFLDHLMREGPSNNPRLVPVRRSFFARDGQRADLGGAIEVFRGVYQSIRMAQGPKLVVNLDVANSCFWKPQLLIPTILQKNGWRDPSQIAQQFQRDDQVRATQKYLKKLSVKANYKGNKQPNTVWKIDSIARVNANTHRITWRDPQTGKETGERISVAAYFARRYNLNLQFPNLPLIQMTKKMKGEPVYFPMELLVIIENQRYGAKLDETQTANMIKFAVSPPNQRLASINDGKSWLGWDTDKYLKEYGLQINKQQVVTSARVLPPPGVKFKNKTEQPGTKGRWDLRAKQFINPNQKELGSWGIGIFGGRVALNPGAIEKFAMDFVKAYRGHGGLVSNNKPFYMKLNDDPGKAVEDLFQATGNNFKARPQILIFLVQNRNAQHYLRIKKSCDKRFGVVSQVMQAAQVQKGNPQYYSNVLMKFNAKLGGATAQVVPAKDSGFSGQFPVPTLFIGADVSHASPGSEQASMAAITVSYDRFGGRYAAGCQTNGHRVEMITENNMKSILGPLISNWMSEIGGGRVPGQVYYMRDGVSEGQFTKVIQEEVPHIRAVLDKLSNGKWGGKLTVVIASKRHHLRAFPKQGDGDQKGNPLPGTLIEKDITMPNEWDFFLYSHIALQGTSRPVHYTVLLDEARHSPAALQNMIYEHCYQYMRSTTSVSLHPAVYYAHLASNRAKAHENVAAALGPQGGAGFKQNQSASSDTPRSSETAPLLAWPTGQRVEYSMWYI